MTESFESPESLEKAFREIRGYILIALHCAGSGHSGGSLSAVELAGTAFLREMRHRPHEPSWPDRDRLYFSAGHKAPLWYALLGYCGYFPIQETALLRKFGSPFQGHPDMSKLPGLELSCGSLGQGLSVAVGDALSARIQKKDYRVFCLMGDGEQQEGQIWEAAMAAGHYALENLVGMVDKNSLQIDGLVDEVMRIDPLKEKYEAFGWRVLECEGNSAPSVLEAFEKARVPSGKPTLIIGRTVKGAGVSFMEGQASWHGKSPDFPELMKALSELGLEHLPYREMIQRAAEHQRSMDAEISRSMPAFSRSYWWNEGPAMAVDMKPTRKGFGEALRETKDERVCALGSDISASICIDEFHKGRPDRKERWISMGIAEQSATSAAAGLAKNGFVPFIGTYGVFAAGRALDQLRTTICYGNFDVKIAGAHAGISVGPDGATHQALEEIYQIAGLPNMCLLSGADAEETRKATHGAIARPGPCYIRFAREATPAVSLPDSPFEIGKATVIKYLGEEKPRFIDAFSTVFAADYRGPGDDVALAATGPVVAEAMRAAWILKREFGIEARVLNFSTLKPLDIEAIERTAGEVKAMVTVEEHQKGGFGNLVAAALMAGNQRNGLRFAMMGIEDRFGTSGAPWELMKHFGLTAEHIAQKAAGLLGMPAKPPKPDSP
ncbi:MAG: transketolase [Spirochaetota bacterium]